MQNKFTQEIDSGMSDLACLFLIQNKLNKDDSYQSAFKAELKKTEATELVNKGVYLENPDDFINERIKGILSFKETAFIPKDKIELVQKKRADSTTIIEDVRAFKKAEQSAFSLVEKAGNSFIFSENESPFTLFKALIKSIPEELKQFYQELINQQHFTFETLAKDDFEAYQKNELSAYELHKKMTDKPDYKKSIEQLISENVPNFLIGSQKENYLANKLKEITEAVNGLNDEEKTKHKRAFNEKYPNGFKLSREIEAQTINQSLDGYDEYKKLVNKFIDDEKDNDNERIKRTQALMDFYLKNPDKMDSLGERYINDVNIKTTLPEQKFSIVQSLKTGKNLTTELQAKLLKQTQVIIKHAQSLGDNAKKSIEQLQQYRMRQFKQEHTEVKKKLIDQQMSIKENKKRTQKQGLRI